MKARIVTIHVPVSDIERARRFYTGVMGCRVVSDQEERAGQSNRRLVRLQPAGGGTAFVLANWHPTMPAGCLRGLMFLVADLDAARAQLLAKGVPVAPIAETSWARIALVTDPDGNQIAIEQVHSHREAEV
jgi:predicted enzyme related to lactoylglutathione lyase